MKKRLILIAVSLLAILAVAFPLRGAVTGLMPQSQAADIQQVDPIPGMSELLNYPYDVAITDLPEGDPQRQLVLDKLLGRPETIELMAAMEGKGFVFDPAQAEVMRIEIATDAQPVTVEAMTMSTIAHELSGALTAMLPMDGSEGFFQAHHTNLDPNLAGVPDPPIVVNGMPYFYITSLRWVYGRIIYWNYWWFDSHHHPNWYYSHYYWYWRYYGWYDWPWPYWYWWAHGWYYWRYWYFWSTWFPY